MEACTLAHTALHTILNGKQNFTDSLTMGHSIARKVHSIVSDAVEVGSHNLLQVKSRLKDIDELLQQI